MLDMARAPRRLQVMSAVGDWRDSTEGHRARLPRGDLCHGLAAAVAEGPSRLQPGGQDQVLVDDSMAWGRGETAGFVVWAGAARDMEDLEQGDGLKVNRKKSGVVVSHNSSSWHKPRPRGAAVLDDL